MSKYGMGQRRVASSWISRTRNDGHAEMTAAMTARTAVRVAHVSFDFGPTSKNETKTMAAVNTVPSKIRTNSLTNDLPANGQSIACWWLCKRACRHHSMMFHRQTQPYQPNQQVASSLYQRKPNLVELQKMTSWVSVWHQLV